MSGGQRRLHGELTRRVNYMAATATDLAASGIRCVPVAWRFPNGDSGKGRAGLSRSPWSVIGHCRRRFRQGDPGWSVSGTRGQDRARDARPEGRDPQPMPGATHSEASMAFPARLLARQGSPVAKRCARITATTDPKIAAKGHEHAVCPAVVAVSVPGDQERGPCDRDHQERPEKGNGREAIERSDDRGPPAEPGERQRARGRRGPSEARSASEAPNDLAGGGRERPAAAGFGAGPSPAAGSAPPAAGRGSTPASARRSGCQRRRPWTSGGRRP